MESVCLNSECRNCEWHIIKSGKLDCNYNSRLGIGKPKLAEIVEEEVEEE